MEEKLIIMLGCLVVIIFMLFIILSVDFLRQGMGKAPTLHVIQRASIN